MQPSSTTTTNKARWILEKVSRSLSPSRGSRNGFDSRGGGGFGESATKRAALERIEWEHRTQKQHYLELETVSAVSDNSSPRQQLQKMHLDILFDSLAASHPESPSPGHQQISLLSLELTSFSLPSIAACTPQDQLPLKAVYKGSVVGIRYLRISPEELLKGRLAETEWRRVQLKFVSVEERKRFIEAIRGVCPVKLADGATEEDQQLPSPKKSRRSKEAEGGQAGATEDDTARQTLPYELEPPRPLAPNPLSIEATPVAAHPAPPRSTTGSSSAASQPLPPAIAALLPKLAQTLQPRSSIEALERTSREMAEMDESTFGALFAEVVAEDGFDKLVAKVQGCLNARKSD